MNHFFTVLQNDSRTLKFTTFPFGYAIENQKNLDFNFSLG